MGTAGLITCHAGHAGLSHGCHESIDDANADAMLWW
jgi:hypothetical protein